MKKINIKYILFSMLFVSGLFATSCTGDLDRFPPNKETEEQVYSNIEGFRGAATKIYASMALPGNQGPAGEDDLVGMDVGTLASFLRAFYNMQDLPTEMALCCWTDPGVSEQNYINFAPTNPIIKGMYYRLGINLTFANDFLRHTTDSYLNSKGLSESEILEIYGLKDQTRFLRAYLYWAYIDMFGNVPFFTEDHSLGSLPQQGSRKEVYEFIEAELLDLASNNSYLKDARSDSYGRVDKGAVNALLARLYLNAGVYTGTPQWTNAATYAEKVINSGYSLVNNYEHLFLADNNQNNTEAIFSINFNGVETKAFGGTTFLVNCAFQTAMAEEYDLNYGISTNAGWGGNRARLQLSQKFSDDDKRNLFVGDIWSITNVGQFLEGRATYKWRNITKSGQNGSNAEFTDIDFPLFRLSEMYLIYAEAVKRGGAGSESSALNYLNTIRERAFGGTSGNYKSFGDVTLDELLDERARELYWECHRRTDLVRYDYFTTSNYIWEWKGAVKNGRGVSSHFNVYPIPSSELVSNPNLKQNNGY